MLLWWKWLWLCSGTEGSGVHCYVCNVLCWRWPTTEVCWGCHLPGCCAGKSRSHSLKSRLTHALVLKISWVSMFGKHAVANKNATFKFIWSLRQSGSILHGLYDMFFESKDSSKDTRPYFWDRYTWELWACTACGSHVHLVIIYWSVSSSDHSIWVVMHVTWKCVITSEQEWPLACSVSTALHHPWEEPLYQRENLVFIWF